MSKENENLKTKLRCLVSTVYDIQQLRIQTGNRVCQSFLQQMGVQPSKKKEDADEECKKLIKELEKEYNRVADLMVDNKISLKKAIHTFQTDSEREHLQYIRDDLDYKFIENYIRLQKNEQEVVKIIAKYVHQCEIWDKFFKDVYGCGELMAAVCIAYLDASKARHVSSFWKYCGVDVVDSTDNDGNVVYDDFGNVVTHGRRMVDTEMREYIAKDGSIKQKKSLTYNPIIKAKLCGVLSGCIIKAGQRFGYNKYEEAYRDYRKRLDNNAKHSDKQDIHKHKMAVRYMIKQFLRDLWVAMREVDGLSVTEPYEVAFLGRNPHKFNEAHNNTAQKYKK